MCIHSPDKVSPPTCNTPVVFAPPTPRRTGGDKIDCYFAHPPLLPRHHHTSAATLHWYRSPSALAKALRYTRSTGRKSQLLESQSDRHKLPSSPSPLDIPTRHHLLETCQSNPRLTPCLFQQDLRTRRSTLRVSTEPYPKYPAIKHHPQYSAFCR